MEEVNRYQVNLGLLMTAMTCGGFKVIRFSCSNGLARCWGRFGSTLQSVK